MRITLIQITYLAATVLFVLGLKSLTRPAEARRGMQMAAVGMLMAIIGTLLNQQIVDYKWIAAGLIVGSLIGYPLGMWVPMTAMPQRVAMALSLGALAATLVGVVEYFTAMHTLGTLSHAKAAALGFEVMLGALTVTGAFIATGKLQEFITAKPVLYKGQNIVNSIIFLAMIALLVTVIVDPTNQVAFYTMIGVAAVFGISLVMPIGGADMPVVIALLNSYAGLASAATGFALDNTILIVAGAFDGASGFILSMLMSKAMNRSFANILFGGFGSGGGATPVAGATGGEVRAITAEDSAFQLAYAQLVVIIPGYGVAVAQAQHTVRELAELIQKQGGEVRYAIHPVAGRMPGHMNVILSEAGVEYDNLVNEIDDANALLERADVALIIGANDIVNPAALDEPSSPIYGMPVLKPWLSRTTIVMKRSMAAGFAGIDNPLFYKQNTVMLFGDAKASTKSLVTEIKALVEEGAHV
ncbi:MAG TPA: NAD(P)(+) transhydrogenase (Re/Si-specific) subunit beta [Gemmatimonadaceae bacterium]|nr:NAD(P)(+) transhydrogenase (Re/Si-specific) subunit beta [Gemmatimonadaceae bacterium]